MPIASSFYLPNFPSYRPLSSSVETNLILTRIAAGLPTEGFNESTLLDLQLRRHERRSRLSRNSSLNNKHSRFSLLNRDSEEYEDKYEPKKVTEVKDKLGNLVYRRGEKDQDRLARDLDQWIRRMKSTFGTGMRLEQFKDLKIGIYPSPVIYGSPSIEPFPKMRDEKFSYKGGKDRKGNYKGRGVIEFENGDTIVGMFEDGQRHGECRIETGRNGMSSLSGVYANGKLEGKAKVIFENGTWMECYFKEGVQHGFTRIFDETGRLKFVGNYRNGKPFGICWKIIKGGGFVVGRVDDEGNLSGIRVAYIYPDYTTALVGTFTDGILDFAQVAYLKGVVDDLGMKIPIFTEPDGRLYRREIATYDFVTSMPMLPDPYEAEMVEVRKSKVPGANDGLFARKRIENDTVIAFYNGKRIRPKSAEDKVDRADWDDWNLNAYKIFDPAIKNGTIDIPLEYQDMEKYCASVAHKTNHSFLPNAEFVTYDHPRFGMVPCLVSIAEIQKGEEIFVHYGYELEGCPDWYEEAWQRGTYPIPDSIKRAWEEEAKKAAEEEEKNGEEQKEEEGKKEEQNGSPRRPSVDWRYYSKTYSLSLRKSTTTSQLQCHSNQS